MEKKFIAIEYWWTNLNIVQFNLFINIQPHRRIDCNWTLINKYKCCLIYCQYSTSHMHSLNVDAKQCSIAMNAYVRLNDDDQIKKYLHSFTHIAIEC